MAELTLIAFRHGQSLLHRLDVRFKMIAMAALSISSLNAGPRGLFFFTLLIGMLTCVTGPGFGAILREIRYFSILLLFVLLARGLAVPGAPLLEFKFISISQEGLYQGGLICWRLVLMVLMGILFVVTSRPSAIRAGVQWMLTPIPYIPEKKVAIMIGLTVRFVPVILDQVKKTLDAQRARGVEQRKNPFYRIVKLIIPLMRRIFLDADQLILAMESRGFGENRTPPHLSANRRDWLSLGAVVSLSVALILL